MIGDLGWSGFHCLSLAQRKGWGGVHLKLLKTRGSGWRSQTIKVRNGADLLLLRGGDAGYLMPRGWREQLADVVAGLGQRMSGA